MKFRCWSWWDLLGFSFYICRNELHLGDEVYWLAREFEPRLGVITSCFGETDINAFGYFYSVGSVCTNDHVPKLTLSRYVLGRGTVEFGTSCFFFLFLELRVIVFCFVCKYLWAAIILKCIYQKWIIRCSCKTKGKKKNKLKFLVKMNCIDF